jgi:hypothetical protein
VVACGGSGGTSPLATWANVRDVVEGNGLTYSCHGAECHTEGEHEPILFGLNSASLSDAALYSKLTTYKTTKCGHRAMVNPCAPDDSAFALALAGRCEGINQMPNGCSQEYGSCTPDDMLEGIRQWIASGAPPP